MKRTVIKNAPVTSVVVLNNCRDDSYYGVTVNAETTGTPVDLNNRGYITKVNGYYVCSDVDDFTGGACAWNGSRYQKPDLKTLIGSVIDNGGEVFQFDALSELALFLEGK